MSARDHSVRDAFVAPVADLPAHLHAHLVQLYLIRHRRPPRTEAEQRRAVYEYLARTRHDRTGTLPVLVHPELEAWLHAEDEHVRGWGAVPRLAALVLQFNRSLRKRFDLAVERDYKAFACHLALTLQTALRWPECVIAPSLRAVLWEPAPGVNVRSRVPCTRAFQYVQRHAAARARSSSSFESFGRLLLAILADVEAGRLPSYVLSPEQLEQLGAPVSVRAAKVPLTGLLHHLLVERGLVKEGDLSRPDVADTVRREIPRLLSRLTLPAPLRAAHRAYLPPVIALPAEVEPTRERVVTVVGPLSHGSGLGAAARACVEAFKAAELPVEVLNLNAQWGRNDESAGSGEAPVVRGDINVLHFNPDVLFENLARFGFAPFEGRYNIGYFVWETSKATQAHRLGVELVDEIWVPTEYCRALFAAITDKPVVVVKTPVPRIEDVSWASRRAFELDASRFTFGFTCDGASRFTRKNPLGAIQAFLRAFPSNDDVQFVLKTQNTEHLTPVDERLYAEIRRLARADRRIVVIDESFTSNEVHGLISTFDCYVALHRSEGFGYGMTEAMKLRVPVVATGDSGNADFVTSDTGYPVRSTRVPVPRGAFVYEEEGQEWAEPDLDHAAQCLREVRTDPARARRIEAALALLARDYDDAAVGERYRQRIEAIRAGAREGEPAIRRGSVQ